MPKTSRLGDIVAMSLGLQLMNMSEEKKFQFEKTDLVLINNQSGSQPSNDKQVLHQAIGQGAAIFVIKPAKEEREVLETPLNNGLLLNDKDRLILIPRQEMAYVAYPISLRPTKQF